jgi:hypothetical protein
VIDAPGLAIVSAARSTSPSTDRHDVVDVGPVEQHGDVGDLRERGARRRVDAAATSRSDTTTQMTARAGRAVGEHLASPGSAVSSIPVRVRAAASRARSTGWWCAAG